MDILTKELLQNGITGVFFLVLIYFAREVLFSIKGYLKETREEKRDYEKESQKLIYGLMQEIKSLHEEHRRHLVQTQGQLIDVISENTRAYVKLAESHNNISEGNELIAEAIQCQNKLIEKLEFKSVTTK